MFPRFAPLFRQRADFDVPRLWGVAMGATWLRSVEEFRARLGHDRPLLRRFELGELGLTEGSGRGLRRRGTDADDLVAER